MKGYKMQRINYVLFIVLVLALTGCSFINRFIPSKDNSLPPEPLKPVESQVELKKKWSKITGDGSDAKAYFLNPILMNESIITVDLEGRIRKLDASTGRYQLKVELDDQITAGIGGGSEQIYLGSDRGEVIALNSNTGAVNWRSQVSSVILSSPQESQGIVIVHTNDGNLFGLSALTGEQLWRYEGNQPPLTLRGSSQPVIADDYVIVGFSNGHMALFDIKNGQKLFDQPVAMPQGRSEVQRMVDIVSPVIAAYNIVYVVTYQGRVAALDMVNARVVWEREMSSYRAMTLDTTALYVTDSEGVIWALERDTGITLWKQEDLLRRSPTAVHIFDNYLVVGDYQGYVHVMSRLTGKILGRKKVTDFGIQSEPISKKDLLYIYGEEGRIVALEFK